MNYTTFDDIEVSPDWSFENVRSTEQWTHGYHRYPAKFLPNVVKKLIEQYAPKDSLVVDLFAGCGTTLVEAKVHGLESIGTDINPIATLITKVKTKPINPEILQKEYDALIDKLQLFDPDKFPKLSNHPRIDYWFREEEKKKIAYLYRIIYNVENNDVKDFFLVSVSHILKNTSRWLQSSTKPQIDPNKKISCPFLTFKKHTQKMMKGNFSFFQEIQKNNNLDIPCSIYLRDARNTGLDSNIADIIVTSPPYVTSYEYADIHQLTGYWMNFIEDIVEFRKSFIGTSYSHNRDVSGFLSPLANSVINQLLQANKKIAFDVANYFYDMRLVAQEMFRLLKPKGYACIVIGNTTLKNVHVKSAEIFYDFLISFGFSKVQIIKRNIPNKLMPTLRDLKTGKFTTIDNKDCKRVYPDEFIIIVKK